MSDPVALAIIAMMAATVSSVVAIVGKLLANRLDKADANAERREAQVIEVAGKVYEIGEQIDGRLSQLLASARSEGTAQGFTAGEAAQRERENEP